MQSPQRNRETESKLSAKMQCKAYSNSYLTWTELGFGLRIRLELVPVPGLGVADWG